MIKQIIVCDRCGKEIPEGQKIGYVAINQRTKPLGDFISDNDFEKMDYCEECITAIKQFITHEQFVTVGPEGVMAAANVQEIAIAARNEEIVEPEENVIETNVAAVAPAQSPKRIDYGKIKALSDAGWNAARIAEEMGMTPQAVYDAKYKIKAGKVKICND